MKPRTPQPADFQATAVVQLAGGTWRALATRATASGGLTLVGAREFPSAEWGPVAAWLAEQGATTNVVGILPAAKVICRTATFPAVERAALESALRLQAEAHMLGMVPPHRLAMAVLDQAEAESQRTGLILGWPENAAAPCGAHVAEYVPDIAAMAALLGPNRPADALVWADSDDGSVAVAVAHAGGLALRATTEDMTEAGGLPAALRRTVAETALSAGHGGGAVQSLAASLQKPLELLSPAGRGLIVPADVVAAAAQRIVGVPTEAAWWSKFGLLVGGVLARTGTLNALTHLKAAAPIEHPSLVDRVTGALSRPRTAVRIVVACLLVLVLGPLVFAGLRLQVLQWRFGDIDDRLAAVQSASDKLVIYNDMATKVWPMTRLMAEIFNNTPPGVELDSIRLDQSSGIFSVTGTVKPTDGLKPQDVVSNMQARLQERGLFNELRLSWGDGDSLNVYEFDLSGAVRAPYQPTKYKPEEDYAVYTMQDRVDRKPPPTTADAALAKGPTAPSLQEPPTSSDPDGGPPVGTRAEAQPDDELDPASSPTRTPDRDRPRSTVVPSGTSDAGSITDAPATLPASQDIPEPVTAEQIAAMTLEDAKIHLGKVAKARRFADGNKELDDRLRSEFNLLMDRIRKG